MMRQAARVDVLEQATGGFEPLLPQCMDRLPFASEGVLSEVADMYPAC
jgi:hypothetical protein